MQVSYYNIGRAVWEPLIEPVEVLKDYQYKHVPWELKMEVIIITKTLQKKKSGTLCIQCNCCGRDVSNDTLFIKIH